MKPKIAPFQMTSHIITDSEFKVKDGFSNKKLKPDLDISPTFEVYEDENHLTGKLELEIKFNLKSGRIIFIGFKAKIIGTFVSPKKIGKDQFIKFLKYSGTPMLIQIVRSFLMSLSSQSGLVPPIVIPIIDSTSCYHETEGD